MTNCHPLQNGQKSWKYSGFAIVLTVFVFEKYKNYTKEINSVCWFGLLFSNKVLQKLKLSKNEKCAPEMIFFNEKNLERFI